MAQGFHPVLARRLVQHVENRGILDDLDVRASDLLQSNGVVWLEGPSEGPSDWVRVTAFATSFYYRFARRVPSERRRRFDVIRSNAYTSQRRPAPCDRAGLLR
jgi:hypothetical protein